MTADTALRLSQFFGNSAKFWLGLQGDFDLEAELAEKREEFGHIKPFAAACTVHFVYEGPLLVITYNLITVSHPAIV